MLLIMEGNVYDILATNFPVGHMVDGEYNKHADQKMNDFEIKMEDLAVGLFKAKAIKFGEFKLKSGLISPVYFDLRVLVSHPRIMDEIAQLLVDLIRRKRVMPAQVCGVPYTALPIATLVSQKTDIPMVMRRKEGKKEYGTMNCIEGQFNLGESCAIIEDVITSGSSVWETAQDLEKSGLKVTDALVVIDREQGGLSNLTALGLDVTILLPLSKLLDILCYKGCITDETVNSVRAYVADPQNKANMKVNSAQLGNPRLKMAMPDRIDTTDNELTRKILRNIEKKQSLLVVAVDVSTSAELLEIAHEISQSVIAIKTHVDAIKDFSETIAKQLRQLADEKDFFIFEDRKFADIGNVVSQQFSIISDWADLVTAHALPGSAIISGLRKGAGSQSRGVFIVAEMSSAGALTGSAYAQESLKMAEQHKDFVVGLVCQSNNLITDPGLLQLTPGVHRSSTGDDLGQQYVDPRSAVLEKGADLAVVGRGIIKALNRRDAAEEYRKELWQAYCERVGR